MTSVLTDRSPHASCEWQKKRKLRSFDFFELRKPTRLSCAPLVSPGLPWAILIPRGLLWARMGGRGLSWAPLGSLCSSRLPWAPMGFPVISWAPWALLGSPVLHWAGNGFRASENQFANAHISKTAKINVMRSENKLEKLEMAFANPKISLRMHNSLKLRNCMP